MPLLFWGLLYRAQYQQSWNVVSGATTPTRPARFLAPNSKLLCPPPLGIPQVLGRTLLLFQGIILLFRAFPLYQRKLSVFSGATTPTKRTPFLALSSKLLCPPLWYPAGARWSGGFFYFEQLLYIGHSTSGGGVCRSLLQRHSYPTVSHPILTRPPVFRSC